MGRLVGYKCAAVLGIAAGAYAAWVRPRLMGWGSTDEEIAGEYPGAELKRRGEGATSPASLEIHPRYRNHPVPA